MRTDAEIADLRERLRRTWAEDYGFGFPQRVNAFPAATPTGAGGAVSP